jgi:hypothetical protein
MDDLTFMIELIALLGGLVGGPILAYYKWDRIKPTFRADLKADLEILKLVEESKYLVDDVKLIKNRIKENINIHYTKPTERKEKLSGLKIASLSVELLIFLAFFGGTVYFVNIGIWWWAIPTAIFSFITFLVLIGESVTTIPPERIPLLNDKPKDEKSEDSVKEINEDKVTQPLESKDRKAISKCPECNGPIMYDYYERIIKCMKCKKKFPIESYRLVDKQK